ncbi:hypothetical protein [Dietzia sp. B44]|uniref:hypothetical protein n=1 Tax=Dietzia sp. B44 TaxID=1630633 RepID=UPI0015F956D2|nr:hypothetical protein [Dietzia sp. B44]MBB1053831.1 hypothetical protein [Dietzia sp. B44]
MPRVGCYRRSGAIRTTIFPVLAPRIMPRNASSVLDAVDDGLNFPTDSRDVAWIVTQNCRRRRLAALV